MKIKMSFDSDYDSKYEWDCFCQGGNSGVVLPSGSFSKLLGGNALEGLSEGLASKETYTTAFFEAFPKKPSCFLRGEGKTIEDAEESCWQKYQKVLNCNHEMERRDRTDGYGYCKHCSYSSTIFEPLTKCCKCGKPTAFTNDYKKNWYCEKHQRFTLKNPNPSRWSPNDKKLPRKRKKLLKKCATNKFRSEGVFGKVTVSNGYSIKFSCNKYQFSLLFHKQEQSLIKKYGK